MKGKATDMKSVLVRLREYRNKASATENTIIQFVLDHPKATSRMTVYELAEKTFASPASIIRLCKKNGFKGYRDFVNTLIYEMAIRENSQSAEKEEITKFDRIEEIIDKITYRNIVSLEDTRSILDHEVIAECIKLLQTCQTVNLFGIGSSLLVAKDAQLKFTRLNKRCFVSDDWHLQLLTARQMTPNDLGIVISYSGETAEMLECAKAMKERGAKIITITRYGNSPIAAMGDYAIYVAANEGLYRSGAMSSRISQLNVIDILYTGYVNAEYEKSLEQISRTHIQKRDPNSNLNESN